MFNKMLKKFVDLLIDKKNSFFLRYFFIRSPQQIIKINGRKNINKLSNRLGSSWQNDSIPKIQRELVDKQIKKFRDGKPIDVFDSLVNELRCIINSEVESLLEIGCSSGYYSEVFEIAGIPMKYTGCDYSKSFIEMARAYYPSNDFCICDARTLPFEDSSFHVVISGCCILHIREYTLAIKEAVRVSSNYVIFHRTPTLAQKETTFYTKSAYGVEMLEIHFNENELRDIFYQNNLSVVKTVPIDIQFDSKGREISGNKIYVCKKNE